VDFVEGLAVWLQGIAGMARAVSRLLQHLHLQVCVGVIDELVSVNTERSQSCTWTFLQVGRRWCQTKFYTGADRSQSFQP
jgi:hypothetical protein